jgi:hypothetical protein
MATDEWQDQSGWLQCAIRGSKCMYFSVCQWLLCVLLCSGHPRSEQVPSDYWHIYMNTGDCGPDQQGSRGSLRTKAALLPSMSKVLMWTMNCMKLTDKFLRRLASGTQKATKYYSGLATLSHTWRGSAAKLRRTWQNNHPTETIALSFPPLAIAGRWATVHGHSDRLSWMVIFIFVES